MSERVWLGIWKISTKRGKKVDVAWCHILQRNGFDWGNQQWEARRTSPQGGLICSLLVEKHSLLEKSSRKAVTSEIGFQLEKESEANAWEDVECIGNFSNDWKGFLRNLMEVFEAFGRDEILGQISGEILRDIRYKCSDDEGGWALGIELLVVIDINIDISSMGVIYNGTYGKMNNQYLL